LSAFALLLLLASPTAAQGPPWTGHLRDLAPAMRACLAGKPGAIVVMSWPMNHGMALSRLLLANGAREDCVADLGSGRVESIAPVAAGERLPGEGVQAFMLERGCVDARRVEDAEGRILGWLAYPACR
jgi:hypothetical protein